jgi:FAD/FMN-containing dehydrogenase
MYDISGAAGYVTGNMGVYVQPIVQGVNFHVEFDLFYDPGNRKEAGAVKGLAADVINPLISRGAFFSRPYGESARAILNRDAATVQALKKVKTILDPDNVMNPGKLCF